MIHLLKAAHFAAEKHSRQRRKNPEATPYINHPIEVAQHLSTVGGIIDEAVLMAALLHDTVEDTETTYEELLEHFDKHVADLVMECTDDKNLPKQERKRLQVVNAPHKSTGAKLIKIADKSCNLRSILTDPPEGWSRQRQFEYFKWAEQVVSGLLGHNPALDAEIKQVLRSGFEQLS